MKSLILIFILLVPFSLLAQDKDESSTMSNETNVWMNKISSDSEMRSKMMDMMIEKTIGNDVEMRKLVNSVLNNPEMNKMIFAAVNRKTDITDTSLEPRGMMNDSVKVRKMSKVRSSEEKK